MKVIRLWEPRAFSLCLLRTMERGGSPAKANEDERTNTQKDTHAIRPRGSYIYFTLHTVDACIRQLCANVR